MSIDRTQISKFMSFVLRHKPDAIGLALDSQGWASIEELIDKANVAGTKFDRQSFFTSSKPATRCDFRSRQMACAFGQPKDIQYRSSSGCRPKSPRRCCITGPRRGLWKRSLNRD